MDKKSLHESVIKPWGSYTTFTHNEPSTVKLLYISKGEAFSLQFHSHRDEFWKVLKGNPTITVGENSVLARPDDEFTITQGTHHRIEALEDDVVVLEISKGDFDENDITRLEDKYGRS